MLTDPVLIDQYYIAIIYEEAKRAYFKGEVPVASCVVQFNQKSHKVLSLCHNLKETNKDVTAHAEILAIKQASLKLSDWRLTDCVLYSTLEPCIMCAGAIVHSRVRRVVYCAYDFKWGGFGSQINISKCERINHIVDTNFYENPRYSKLLKRFFKQRRS